MQLAAVDSYEFIGKSTDRGFHRDGCSGNELLPVIRIKKARRPTGGKHVRNLVLTNALGLHCAISLAGEKGV
jgi:hypothetical protein